MGEKMLQIMPMADVSAYVQGGSVVAFGAAENGDVYLAVGRKMRDCYDYRVLSFSRFGDVLLDTMIRGEALEIHHIQPLGNDLLLASARTRYRGVDNFDRNGRVYSRNGELLREMLLGDGIQGLQTTRDGTIWTSFFDEGVLGNLGWNEPVGASGLIAWDQLGNPIYKFDAEGGSDSMVDCYALNAVSQDSIWIYYYTPFDLVHLNRKGIASRWTMPISGSHAFAVRRQHVLFHGSYGDRDACHLVSLGAKPELVATFYVCDAEKERIIARSVEGRGDALYILNKAGLCYRVTVDDAVKRSRV